jgi:hypothetical protein
MDHIDIHRVPPAIRAVVHRKIVDGFVDIGVLRPLLGNDPERCLSNVVVLASEKAFCDCVKTAVERPTNELLGSTFNELKGLVQPAQPAAKSTNPDKITIIFFILNNFRI